MDFIGLFMDTKFQGYTLLLHNAKDYDGYFIFSQLLLKEKMDV